MTISKLKTRPLKMSSTLLLTLLLLLTACADTNFNSCPPVKIYSNEEQDAAYAEMNHLRRDSEVRAMMNDYKQLRDENRACAK